MLSPLSTYRRADAWRQQHPAPVQRIYPTEPTSYARLSWYVAAFVAWVIVGTCLAKCHPTPTATPAPTATAAAGRWVAR